MELFAEMRTKIDRSKLLKIAVASAEDIEVLTAVKEALELNLASFYLVGDEEKIRQNASDINLSLDYMEIANYPNPIDSSRKAVELVSSGQAQILMKGLIATATILKAVLDKEIGLRTGKVLSHVAVFEVAGFLRPLLLTDAAMNILPSFEQKIGIVQNAIELAHNLGIEQPKVAMLAAVETVNPTMQATIDAALIAKMAERGQIKGAIIDGPLALDNAISKAAADHKGIQSAVAGAVDIIMVPNIEVGNTLYKSLVYFGKAKVGAVVTGASSSIILTSRSDSHETKLNSIILAVLAEQDRY